MADTDRVLDLAAIIREVDGNHSKGAAALAESILDHPDFRAALTKPDEPAVPQGREPAAVSGRPRPMEDDVEDAAQCIYEAMRFERVETTPAWSELGNSLAQDTARKAARAVLARWGNPAPQPPADGEVAALVEWLQEDADDYECIGCEDSVAKCNRAAELLERQVPLPVAVSERLPEPSDCAPWPDEPAASAWCWVGSDVDGGWSWEQRSAGCLAAFPDDFTHWLPAHALPLPEVGA